MITKHPLDPQDAITMAKLRSLLASTKSSVTEPATRPPFDELMEQTPPAVGVAYERAEVGRVCGCISAHRAFGGCSQATGKPEVIRRRKLGRIRDFGQTA